MHRLPVIKPKITGFIRQPVSLSRALNFLEYLLKFTQTFPPHHPTRNRINRDVLNLLRPFASYPTLQLHRGSMVKRAESVLQLSLSPGIDVGINREEQTVTIQAGGKAVNHFKACHGLVGIPSDLVTLVSNDPLGQLFCKLLRFNNQLPDNLHLIKNGFGMRVNLHPDSTLISAPGSRVNKNTLARAIAEFKELVDSHDWIVLAGSLHPGIPKNLFLQILSRYGHTKKIIIDNRAMWAQGIIGEVPPFLIKPNMREFTQLVRKYFPEAAQGISEETLPQEVVTLAQRLVREKNIPIVIVTKDEHPLIIATSHTTLLVTPPKIKKDSDIGSGDVFIVGMLDILTRYPIGNDPANITREMLVDAAKKATALAAACAEFPGTTFTNDLAKVHQLEQEVKINFI